MWLPEHVLIYGPRPDGKCQIDDLTDKDEVYYVTQVGRALADGFVSKSSLELFHVNRPVSRNAVAMPKTCVARVGAVPILSQNRTLSVEFHRLWRIRAFGAC